MEREREREREERVFYVNDEYNIYITSIHIRYYNRDAKIVLCLHQMPMLGICRSFLFALLEVFLKVENPYNPNPFPHPLKIYVWFASIGIFDFFVTINS